MLNFFKKPLNALVFTQFLSAFADSAIIIIIALMIRTSLSTDNPHDPYIFVVECFFLFAYVLFAPFVGTFADKNKKSHVLFIGNSIKLTGIILLILGFDPAVSYGIIGIGAAIYGPGKYGTLKELAHDEKTLLDGNGKMEAFTILAIILGTVAGGALSDMGDFGTYVCLVIYILSIIFALRIPTGPGDKSLQYGKEAVHFFRDVKKAFLHKKIHYALVGGASFWMISVVIKNALTIWIPIHLFITGGFSMSLIIGMSAIGIVIGSLLAKKFTSIETFHKANKFGFVTAAFAIIFPFISGDDFISRVTVCALLLGLGAFAGMFIIPLNATLQHEAHGLLGSGQVIAVQNFVNNTAMLFGTFTVYLLNAKYGFSVTASLVTFGFVYLLFILYLTMNGKKFKEKKN